jgi:hypothetical protein
MVTDYKVKAKYRQANLEPKATKAKCLDSGMVGSRMRPPHQYYKLLCGIASHPIRVTLGTITSSGNKLRAKKAIWLAKGREWGARIDY